MSEDFFKNKDLKTDYLTSLYMRDVAVDYAKSLIEEQKPFSLALVDIDNFKNVNDNYGHTTGDIVIKKLAAVLKNSFGERGVVGRFGGDEFIVVIPGITEYDAVWSLLREVHKSVDGLQIEEVKNLYLTCTFGLSRFPLDAKTYDSLFELTDKALYRGKIKGRNCFIIYLESKHKNIQLHSGNDTTISSMQMHTQIFRFLNSAPHIQDGIKDLMLFLGSNLMIDHLGIQTKNGLYFSQVYTLTNSEEFSSISHPFFMDNVSPAMGVYYLNDVANLENINQTALLEECRSQGIKSSLYAVICYNDEIFGYIRADSTSTARIWQYKDMDLLITAANAIAMSLHFQNKKIEEL